MYSYRWNNWNFLEERDDNRSLENGNAFQTKIFGNPEAKVKSVDRTSAT